MLSFEQAHIRAEQFVSQMYPQGSGVEVAINEPFVSERDRGWVFPYNTRAFFASKDPRDGLLGNGPLFVDKVSGQIIRMPSGGWKRMLEEYDRTGVMPIASSGMQRISPGEQPQALDGIAEKLQNLKS